VHKKKVMSNLRIFSFVKIVVVVKITFYSSRGMNHGVSIFSEGIILDDYCYIWNVLTLSVQNVYCKNVLCSANCVAPLGLFFKYVLCVDMCVLSQDKIALV
jgi:hypothetical protein